ncbi:MAG: DUF4214 domain-containing protein, partial [bacterium]
MKKRGLFLIVCLIFIFGCTDDLQEPEDIFFSVCDEFKIDDDVFLNEIFIRILNRNPSSEELTDYLDKISTTSRYDIVHEIMFLDESKNTNFIYDFSKSDEDFINHLFSQFLDKTPTDDELNNLLYFLEQSNNERKDVFLIILNSMEFRLLTNIVKANCNINNNFNNSFYLVNDNYDYFIENNEFRYSYRLFFENNGDFYSVTNENNIILDLDSSFLEIFVNDLMNINSCNSNENCPYGNWKLEIIIEQKKNGNWYFYKDDTFNFYINEVFSCTYSELQETNIYKCENNQRFQKFNKSLDEYSDITNCEDEIVEWIESPCDNNEFCNEDGQCVECLDNSHCDEENNEICNQENQCIIEEDEINIFFHAIVCDYENLLPKWAHHDVNYHNPEKPNKINSTSAIDFIELKRNYCSFDNLKFQFSKDNENWYDIGQSNAEEGLILTLNESKIDEYSINLGELYFRTIENEDYINFSGSNDEDYISAEFYCHEYIELFDNIEKINLEFNKNYYCVAFNTKEPECYIGENKCSSTYGYLNCSVDDYKWVVVEPTVGKDYCENCSEDNIWINDKCCGILENEEIKARFCGSDTDCDTDDSDVACCDSWNSCVFNGECYPNNHLFYEENMYCKEGVWVGGDGNEEVCNEF